MTKYTRLTDRINDYNSSVNYDSSINDVTQRLERVFTGDQGLRTWSERLKEADKIIKESVKASPDNSQTKEQLKDFMSSTVGQHQYFKRKHLSAGLTCAKNQYKTILSYLSEAPATTEKENYRQGWDKIYSEPEKTEPIKIDDSAMELEAKVDATEVPQTIQIKDETATDKITEKEQLLEKVISTEVTQPTVKVVETNTKLYTDPKQATESPAKIYRKLGLVGTLAAAAMLAVGYVTNYVFGNNKTEKPQQATQIEQKVEQTKKEEKEEKKSEQSLVKSAEKKAVKKYDTAKKDMTYEAETNVLYSYEELPRLIDLDKIAYQPVEPVGNMNKTSTQTNASNPNANGNNNETGTDTNKNITPRAKYDEERNNNRLDELVKAATGPVEKYDSFKKVSGSDSEEIYDGFKKVSAGSDAVYDGFEKVTGDAKKRHDRFTKVSGDSPVRYDGFVKVSGDSNLRYDGFRRVSERPSLIKRIGRDISDQAYVYWTEQQLSAPGIEDYKEKGFVPAIKEDGKLIWYSLRNAGLNLTVGADEVVVLGSNGKPLRNADGNYVKAKNMIIPNGRKGFIESLASLVVETTVGTGYELFTLGKTGLRLDFEKGFQKVPGTGVPIGGAFYNVVRAPVSNAIDAGRAIGHTAEDLSRGTVKVIEVPLDATIGNIPGVRKGITGLSNQIQGGIAVFRDIGVPFVGDARRRVYNMDGEKLKTTATEGDASGLIGVPIINNLASHPDSTAYNMSNDPRAKAVSQERAEGAKDPNVTNSEFRKAVETPGVIIVDTLTSIVIQNNAGDDRNHSSGDGGSKKVKGGRHAGSGAKPNTTASDIGGRVGGAGVD